MILELLLVVSLLGNGWQAYDSGELSQSNKQLSQVVEEQSALINQHYVDIGNYEEAIIETEREIQELSASQSKQSLAMEKLRNRNPTVSDYLATEVPDELVRLLQASDKN